MNAYKITQVVVLFAMVFLPLIVYAWLPSNCPGQWINNPGGGYSCLCPNGKLANGWPPSCEGRNGTQQGRFLPEPRINHEPTFYPGHFGAIAFSVSSRSLGYSWDAKTQSDADSVSMQYCRKRANDCRVVVRFNAACGAIAVGSSGGWGADTGSNQDAAESNAIRACISHGNSGCHIIRWVCSKPCNGCIFNPREGSSSQ